MDIGVATEFQLRMGLTHFFDTLWNSSLFCREKHRTFVEMIKDLIRYTTFQDSATVKSPENLSIMAGQNSFLQQSPSAKEMRDMNLESPQEWSLESDLELPADRLFGKTTSSVYLRDLNFYLFPSFNFRNDFLRDVLAEISENFA